MMFEVATAPFYSRHSSAEERPYLFGVGMALSPTAGLTAALSLKGVATYFGENVEAYKYVLCGGGATAVLSMIILLLIREEGPEPLPESNTEERLDWPLAFKFALPEFIIGLGAGLSIPILGLYFTNRFEFNPGTFGLLYGVTQALLMGSFLLAPVVARKLGPVRTVVLFQLTSIPFFLVLALTPAAMPALAVGAYLLRHPCMNMVHPVAANFMMAVAPPRQRARINGMKQLANKIAWVIATWSGLKIVEAFDAFGGVIDGFTPVMLMTIFFYVLGAVLYGRFFKDAPAGEVDPSSPEGGERMADSV